MRSRSRMRSKAARGVSAQEELAELVEQSRRGDGCQEFAHRCDGGLGVGVEREAKLGLESHGPEDAHRIFAKARLGIANETQLACPDVGHAVAVVEQGVVDGGRSRAR